MSLTTSVRQVSKQQSAMSTKQQSAETMAASAAPYNKFVLSFYDLYVIQFSNTFVWQCPSAHILDFYNQHISANHLDVGVGTGYFLDKCQFSIPDPRVALLDLNPNSLEATAKRLQRYQPTTHVGNILDSIKLPPPRFDSIGINYLLHCLPGDMLSKGAVFYHLAPLLTPGGVLFGSTILGQGVPHNVLGRTLMQVYNAKGIFGNFNDNLDDLDDVLAANFPTYSIHVKGCVAFFSAQR